MNIKTLLAKAAKGEELTDEERAFLQNYNPDDALAAARKKAEERQSAAEARVKELETKIGDLEGTIKKAGDAKKTEVELMAETVKRLEQKLDAQDKALKEANEQAKAQARQAKVNKLFAGVKLVDGVDRDMVANAFTGKFADLSDEDLDNASLTTPLIDTWKEGNRALVADDSGHGTGGPAKGGERTPAASGKNPYAKDSFNLTEQLELEQSNPEKAKRLAAEAGSTD